MSYLIASAKIGDRVRISDFYSQMTDTNQSPAWGGKYGKVVGTVWKVTREGGVYVKWDNGQSSNYGYDTTLELVRSSSDLPQHLFDFE